MSNKVEQEVNRIEIPKELRERGKLGVDQAKVEMKQTNKKWAYLLTPIVVAALAFLFINPSNIHEIIPGEPAIETVSQSNAFDTSDPRKLVGFADNVFIGKVIEQVGTKSLDRFPETQFEVEVQNAIKGNLSGKVTVNQQGGYEWNKILLFEGDELLQPGNTYLFATKYLESQHWHTLVPVHGDIPIEGKQEREKMIEKYTKAYNNEIPFEIGQ